MSWYLLFQRQIHGINVGRDHCKALFFLLRVRVQHSVMQIYTSVKGPSRSSLIAHRQPVWPSLPRLVQFLVFSLCSLFLHNIFDSQNFDHYLHSVSSFNPPCSPVALLVHPHICLCYFLCCCPGLSEMWISLCFPCKHQFVGLHIPLPSLAVCASPFHLYHVLMFLTMTEKQTSALCFNKLEPKVLQEFVSPCSLPGFGAILTPSTAELPAGETTLRACICSALCTRL